MRSVMMSCYLGCCYCCATMSFDGADLARSTETGFFDCGSDVNSFSICKNDPVNDSDACGDSTLVTLSDDAISICETMRRATMNMNVNGTASAPYCLCKTDSVLWNNWRRSCGDSINYKNKVYRPLLVSQSCHLLLSIVFASYAHISSNDVSAFDSSLTAISLDLWSVRKSSENLINVFSPMRKWGMQCVSISICVEKRFFLRSHVR